jgi:hypothetical protein
MLIWLVQLPVAVGATEVLVIDLEVVVEVVVVLVLVLLAVVGGLTQEHAELHPRPCFQQLPIDRWLPQVCHPVPGDEGMMGVPKTQRPFTSALRPRRAHHATFVKSEQVPERVGTAALEVVVAVVAVETFSQTHLELHPKPCFQQLPIERWLPQVCHPVPGVEGMIGAPVTQLPFVSALRPLRAQYATLV